ncbi:MAG: T9SS type A sorting domain-containing protein [Candidatus Krumholzibacteria bacterium]|nr:T9SS type A sorting domain-containing protein [Candidatus Krumholzibacteria bacterium]
MKKIAAVSISLCLALLFVASAAFGAGRSAPIVINHLCADLAAIPPDAIVTAQSVCKWHYARLSHGRQLMEGFGIIEAADPFYAAIWPKSGGSLPVAPGMLCIYTDAVASDSYWRGSGINTTRSILNGTPALNISAMSWCSELNTASESYVQEYLTAMQTLEGEFPNVTFVYFTGNGQESGSYGYTRALRNEQIRNFCIANNKVLYDFEDLDSWWYNPATQQWEHSTYEYSGFTVPVEHPNLAGNDAEHTSYASCEQKGRAAWWMMAVLAGWSARTDVGDDESDDPVPNRPPYEGFELSCHPNPCNPAATIDFSLASSGRASLAIYDAQGRLVRTLVEGTLVGGSHSVIWNGTNGSGARVASGVYFSRIVADKKSATKKILLLR